MKLLISEAALSEFEEAVDYYNNEVPGLGYEFAAEVRKTFERIKQFPEAWSKFSVNSRRCFLNKYPYGILYTISSQTIKVVAIMHLKSHPDKWENRTRKSE